LSGGLANGRVRLRLDEVADGFGLREIEAAVGDSSHSEFAGVCCPRAKEEKAVKYAQKERR